MKRLDYLLPVVTLTLLGGIAFGESFDWPQWQGTDRNAMSRQTGLLSEWSEDGPPLVYRVNGLGGGYSAPSVASGRLYGMSSRGADEVAWCRSEAGGQELWSTRLGAALRDGMPQGSEGAGCTPTVDGDRLYVLGLGGELACLHTKDGTVLWHRNLINDFGGHLPTWRYNESPLIDGRQLICTPGGEEATLVALDKSTGELIWQSKVPDASSGQQANERRPGQDRGPSLMQMDPVLAALDANSDKEIASDEIAAAPTVLAKLDKNDDGKLTDDEVTADFGNRGEGGRRSSQGERGPGRGQGEGGRGRRGMSAMRIMPADRALDADENREIDAEELKASATALLTLDKNNDGKLTEDEVAPQFGRRGPSSSAAYASAIAIEVDGQRQYVQLLATTLVGINAADGQLLWRYDRAANRNRINCTTPVYHDGLVFAASAYGNGGGAVKLTKQPDGTFQAEEVYFTTKMQNHHGGVIVYDGCLYGANGGNEGGMLACLDFATGEDLWRDRKAEKGSLAFADGRLYLRTEEGEVVLIEPSRDRFIERGRFAQPDRTESPAWTHPVIANGKLYIRDQDTLFCYDVSK